MTKMNKISLSCGLLLLTFGAFSKDLRNENSANDRITTQIACMKELAKVGIPLGGVWIGYVTTSCQQVVEHSVANEFVSCMSALRNAGMGVQFSPNLAYAFSDCENESLKGSSEDYSLCMSTLADSGLDLNGRNIGYASTSCTKN